jgi:hypothetical protein
MSKLESDYCASLSLLETATELYEHGNAHAYRSVAVELRKLLCDSPSPLLTRVHPEFQLPLLHWPGLLKDYPNLADGLTILVPGRLEFDKHGRPKTKLLIHRSRQMLDLSEWLEQPLFNARITIRELIKSVADKEGAHADPEYNATLRHARSVKYRNEHSHESTTVAIARFLLLFLKQPHNLETK